MYIFDQTGMENIKKVKYLILHNHLLLVSLSWKEKRQGWTILTPLLHQHPTRLPPFIVNEGRISHSHLLSLAFLILVQFKHQHSTAVNRTLISCNHAHVLIVCRYICIYVK